MSFLHSKGFKYLKNLIIGVGAAVVLIGALFKIMHHPLGNVLLPIGMGTEAFIFFFLGVIGPEKDYYWEKLYPGLDKYNADVAPLAAGGGGGQALNAPAVEEKLGGMLSELQIMSKSMSSLKALQDADFTGTADQIKTMGNFYSKLNEAMASLADSAEDAKQYKEQMKSLNHNLGSLNSVYGNMLNAMNP
ncbi:MAG TPA: gliding motility protein GldL, partial [Saprospiraceae bacterium]|nr:gliding motility protein GldL [Saprospiraceae bacterium]